MTEDELNAIVESRLAAALAERLAAEREAMRVQVVLELRREEMRRHYDRINRRAPIESKLAGLTVEQEAERQRQMDERSRITREKMDRANAAPVAGARASLRTVRADQAGGKAGFVIKA